MNVTNQTQDGNNSIAQGIHCTAHINGIHHQIFLAASNIPLSISAIIGNVLILFALRKARSLYPSSKLWLGCLATTDLCVGLITQPLYVALKMSVDHTKQCFYLKTLYIVTSCVFAGVSLSTLTAISVDRLLALLTGLTYRRHVVTLKRARVIVTIFWLYNTMLGLLFLYDFPIHIYVVFATVILCFTTSTFCYKNIYFKLGRHQIHTQESLHQGNNVFSKPSNRRTPLNIARYRKTVSSALWIQVALVLCYLPYIIVIAIYVVTGFRSPPLDFAWSVAITLFLFNSSLNPILYCWKIREVRRAVKNTINHFRWC